MMKLLLIGLLQATVIYCQQCDFSVLQQCMRPPKPQGMPNMDDMKTKVDKCFTDNGCSVPQGPPGGGRGGGSKERGRGGSGGSGSGGDDGCRKKVLDGIKSDLQACVQQKVPGAQLPDPMGGGPGGDHHGMGGGGPDGGHGQRGDRGPRGGGDPFDRMVNDLCKTDAAKAAVKQCLQAYKPPSPGGQGQQKPDFNSMKQQMCQTKQQCLQKLTPQCQQQLKDLKAAVCQCAKDKISPKASQIEASLQACGDGDGRKGGPRGGPQGGQQQGSFVDHFQKMFCGDDQC